MSLPWLSTMVISTKLEPLAAPLPNDRFSPPMFNPRIEFMAD